MVLPNLKNGVEATLLFLPEDKTEEALKCEAPSEEDPIEKVGLISVSSLSAKTVEPKNGRETPEFLAF